MKSIGPRIDPWGTPQVMLKLEDFCPTICTYCDLFKRYDLKRLSEFDLIPLISSFFYEKVMTNCIKRLTEVEEDENKVFFTTKCRVTLLGGFEYSISCGLILEEVILIFVNNIIFVIKFGNSWVQSSFKDLVKKE